MLPCQKQRLSIDLDFSSRRLHGTTIFQLDFTGFQTGGEISLRVETPPHAEAWRVAARGYWPDGHVQSPWMGIPIGEPAPKTMVLQKLEEALFLDAEAIDALHSLVVKNQPDNDESRSHILIELALEWQLKGEWLKPQTSAQHFMELLVHPRDAGGLSDGIGGHQCFETTVAMDFFLAGHVPRSPCWFPMLKTQAEPEHCCFEIDISVPNGLSVCTAGRLVHRKVGHKSTRFTFLETCPLSPYDVVLIAGPLDEAETEGTRVLAPCGFPLDDALAELQKEKQNLVKMLDYPWPLQGCTGIFLPLPQLRPVTLPKFGKADTRLHASSLSSYSIHGNVYIFDLSMLGSLCPSLTSAVIRPLRSYALASAWFGLLIRAAGPEDFWILHGLGRFLADSSLLQSWPSGVAEAEVAARIYEESQLWHTMVQNGQDLQILCGNALMARGSVAEMLGAVREVKSYLVCHQLCRLLGWNAFHQCLAMLLQNFSNRSINTSQFLEKLSEVEDGRDFKEFSEQWIYGVGCPEVHVGWFYNRSIHRLEFVASQTPLEPLALGDFKKSATAPEISWQMTQPRVTKRGIGFGYSGFGEATAELLAAESRLLARARAVSEDVADNDAAIDEVTRKYWTLSLVIDIHLVDDPSVHQIEMNLQGPEPVYVSSLFPSAVERAQEEELPKGLAFLRLKSNQWPLAKMELAQPAEFWQGVLEKSTDPAAEAAAAKVLGDLAVAGKLTNIMLHRVPQALAMPLKEPGWHEITCASCALALCNWAAQLKKGDGLRSSLMRPIHHFLLETSNWRSDTGLARARMLVARSLSGAPKSLELWQNFLTHCRSLKLNSREDPVTLAAVELLANTPRSSITEVVNALQERLHLEEVLPSEMQRLAVSALNTLSLLRLRLAAQEPSPDSFLQPVSAGGSPSSLRRAWASIHAMGSAPSSLEDKNKSLRGQAPPHHKWNRAVRYEACIGSYRGALDGNAFRALSTVLESKEVDQAGEILQEAIWTAEAMVRLPRGGWEASMATKWENLRKLMEQESPQTWPLFRAVLQSLRAWKSGDSRRELRDRFKAQVMAESGEMVLWKTPGLYAKCHQEAPPLRSALAAALQSNQATGEKTVKKLKLR
eukprot:symbB.v1.2.009063.t1/scaffold555.1/size222420/8